MPIENGTGLVNSQDALIVNDDDQGRVADGAGGTGDECCCDEDVPAETECPFCNGTTPKFARVTLSGTTPCAGHVGDANHTICLAEVFECQWATTRTWYSCLAGIPLTGTLSLSSDGAGAGSLHLEIPGVFKGTVDGVSGCASAVIANDYTIADCGGGLFSTFYGGTATVNWGNCEPDCPSCNQPDDGACDCAPDFIVLNLSSVQLQTSISPCRPLIQCLICPNPETHNVSIFCSKVSAPGTPPRYQGTAAISSDCVSGGGGGAEPDTLTARIDRVGCVWHVHVRITGPTMASTFFCGVSGIEPDCGATVVIANASSGDCFDPFCAVNPCGTIPLEGSPLGSAGIATMVPC